MSSSYQQPRFRLLHWMRDCETAEMQLRILLPGNLVNYIELAPDILSADGDVAEATVQSLLPLPTTNDWKCLRVFQNVGSGELGKLTCSGRMAGP